MRNNDHKLDSAAGGVREASSAVELRQTIASEDYDGAGRLVADLGERLLAQFRHGNPPLEAERLLIEASDALHLAKTMVLANRAHLQSRLNQLSRAARYQVAPDETKTHTWRVSG